MGREKRRGGQASTSKVIRFLKGVILMSLQKFKTAIISRAQKVAEMEKNFEPTPRIQAYKQASRQVIIEDYRKALKDAIGGIQAEQGKIRDRHLQARPPLQEQAQRASLDTIRYRAMSTPQLREAVKDTQTLPAFLVDPVEIRCMGAELRSRGDRDSVTQADDLSQWASASNIDQPWVHDPTYKELQNRVERFRVFDTQSQEGLLITSAEPTIGKEDIIRLEVD
jgi:hypothetical protein